MPEGPPVPPIGPDLWARVTALFHRALEQPTSERETFLEAATDDDRVRAEVRSLVRAHERATGFIDPATRPEAASGEPVRIGNYAVRGVLGAGGMGVVYLAEDIRLGRTVALKSIAPQFVHDAARRERLRREARAAAALSHPGIATVYALEEIDDHLYIAGEYVPGDTLRAELAGGPLHPLRAIDTALAVARALLAAHERGIVHRDLKPENLMRTPAGDVKVLDFGLARFLDVSSGEPALTADGAAFGTPAYMSPEQIRGEPVDARADLFALGVVLYEMVTGTHPFSGADPPATIARILEVDPVRPREYLSAINVPAAALGHLERLILTCLRKRPADRFPSARHLVAALEEARAAVSGQVPTPATAGLRPPAADPSRAFWWWRFHQAAAAVSYTLLLAPLWGLRGLSGLGSLLFVAGLIGATMASAIRLHLVFARSLGPAAWGTSSPQSAPWKLGGDFALAGALALEGAFALVADNAWGALLVAAAAAVFVSAVIVEPATTRAAFHTDEAGAPPQRPV